MEFALHLLLPPSGSRHAPCAGRHSGRNIQIPNCHPHGEPRDATPTRRSAELREAAETDPSRLTLVGVAIGKSSDLLNARRSGPTPVPEIGGSEHCAGFGPEILGTPFCTRPSTKATCQPEKPENWYVETWGSASTLGLSAPLRGTSFATGENARRARTCGM